MNYVCTEKKLTVIAVGENRFKKTKLFFRNISRTNAKTYWWYSRENKFLYCMQYKVCLSPTFSTEGKFKYLSSVLKSRLAAQ